MIIGEYVLFIDDERVPTSSVPIIARNYNDAINIMELAGCPYYVMFDHDLGEGELTGYDIAKWIVNRDIAMNGEFMPDYFEFSVHSQNPVGKENIEKLFENYMRVKNELSISSNQ
ncbi:putative response regulator protein [Ochrobactrum phage vB_OspM_OC]|nr:putative response regulator protein [Ochrobactrum phage vB_OspM_OC]